MEIPIQKKSLLRVLIASPLGQDGRGGIDRLNDLLIETIEASPDLGVSVSRLVMRGQGSILAAPGFTLRALATLRRAARNGEVDVLHIHISVRGSTYRKLILAAAARKLAVPYVVHIHGSRFDTFWPGTRGFLRRAIDRLFEESASIIVLGKYWADFVIGQLPAVADKVVILPNATAGLLRPRTKRPEGVVRIAFLGELGARKGTPQLIAALATLADQKDWAATIAGNGDVEGSRQEAIRLGIGDRVTFPGWLGPEASAATMAEADIFVLPSFAENLPMSILEAFAAGAAVVSTPVGAVAEVVDDGRNGLLVKPGDIDGLAGALRRLVEDPQLRQRLAEAGKRDHEAKFEITGYARHLVEIWRKAAASKR